MFRGQHRRCSPGEVLAELAWCGPWRPSVWPRGRSRPVRVFRWVAYPLLMLAGAMLALPPHPGRVRLLAQAIEWDA